MANEIVVSLTLTGSKPSVFTAAFRSLLTAMFDMSSNFYTEGVITVTTLGLAIPLGSVTTPHWFFALNKDATNFIGLKNGTGGALVPKLYPGEPCLFPWDDNATPWAIANAAPCLMEYLIFGR